MSKLEQSEVLYKWVKAEDELPDPKYLIREISTKTTVNHQIIEINDNNIHFDFGGIFSLKYYEWLKPVQSEVELLKNQIKSLKEKIAGDVMYIDSILETNRELLERIFSQDLDIQDLKHKINLGE